MLLDRLAVVWLVALCLIGCREQPASGPHSATAEPLGPVAQQGSRTPTGDPLTPADTVRRVNQLRRAGRFQEMTNYVSQEHQTAVSELIHAVDQLILDNRVLQHCIRASGATASAALFDRSNVANIIGVFSNDITVIKEDVTGATAVVNIQVADRLPLDRVDLELQQDRWVIRPDPPIPGLAAELRNLGQALRRVAEAVETRNLAVDQIDREMEFWQRPVLTRIRKLIDQAERDRRPPAPDGA